MKAVELESAEILQFKRLGELTIFGRATEEIAKPCLSQPMANKRPILRVITLGSVDCWIGISRDDAQRRSRNLPFGNKS